MFIIGSSGAGKSTLTKLILGEEAPTEGEIIINNIDVGSFVTKISRITGAVSEWCSGFQTVKR